MLTVWGGKRHNSTHRLTYAEGSWFKVAGLAFQQQAALFLILFAYAFTNEK